MTSLGNEILTYFAGKRNSDPTGKARNIDLTGFWNTGSVTQINTQSGANSHTPYLQIERARALFLPWSIGNNFIYCHFYLKFRFHAQMNSIVKSFDFPSHAPHVFPFLGDAKSARIAEENKVWFTFRIISQQRDKILVSNFNMILLNSTAFEINWICWYRPTITGEILVWSPTTQKRNSCESRFFSLKLSTF